MKFARGKILHLILMVESLIIFQASNRYKIFIVRTRIVKICLSTKMKALNQNLRSKCCDSISTFLKTRPLVERVYLHALSRTELSLGLFHSSKRRTRLLLKQKDFQDIDRIHGNCEISLKVQKN